MQAELKLFDNRPITLYLQLQRPRRRNVANKKEPGLQVRQESLLAQEAALTGSSEETGSEGYDAEIASSMETPTGSSDLNILDYYRLVNHDANFTKCFRTKWRGKRKDRKRCLPSSSKRVRSAGSS